MRLEDERWGRVKKLFEAVIDLDPNQRAAFVERECGGDEALRSEIESLLESDEQTDGFIEQPAFEIPRDLFPDAREEQLANRQFGPYHVIREIGRGGLGAVYLAARSDDEYRKEVAIKVIRRGLDTEDILRRFRNERQILAQLDHPNIARLIDGGTTDDGLPYFVMEYVKGEPIHTFCDAQALPTAARLHLFRKVCAAVTYAHQNLVIHRDLKPSNILVTQDGEPKLLDFGIAKLLTAENELFTQTLPGLRVMTPEYASPEQVKGDRITTASDVYSLGVLLYQLLTGQLPYRLKTRSAEEIGRAITEQEPERPSTAAAIRNQKSFKGDLDNIVLMAMRKLPGRRYASAGQFSEDIRRHLEGLPVIARKDTAAYRASKFVNRHRLGVAAAALVLLSLVGGIVATLMEVRSTQRERSKAEAISGFLQNTLLASSPERALGKQPTVKDVLDDASKRLATRELSDQPEVKAELQRIVGETYLSLGQYDLAEQNLMAALQAETRIFGDDGIETLKTGVSLAGLWAGAKGDYANANKFYLTHLPRLRAAQKKGTLSADHLCWALNGFALLRRAQGDSKEAESLLREDVALRPYVSEQRIGSLGVAQAVLALTLADQGKFPEAIKIVREKVVAMRRDHNEGTPELAVNLTGLGSFLLENGQTGESLKNLRAAEAIYRKLYNAANLQLGDNIRLQAQAFFAEGNYAEAEASIYETLKIYRAATSPQFINYATALMVQGLIYSQTNRTDEAERLLREAVRIRTENVPETHFLCATANGGLGEFLTAQKRFAEAERFLLVSYESLKNSQAANSPRTKLALQRLAKLYEAWNKPDKAAPYRTLL
ncbi:MAG TPA: serine/threonine-protein kinase, partial [Chthoniobacterales bacterium]|nr:serine/threonine-protein kinase [Chthoniobacterales bacterium]